MGSHTYTITLEPPTRLRSGYVKLERRNIIILPVDFLGYVPLCLHFPYILSLPAFIFHSAIWYMDLQVE